MPLRGLPFQTELAAWPSLLVIAKSPVSVRVSFVFIISGPVSLPLDVRVPTLVRHRLGASACRAVVGGSSVQAFRGSGFQLYRGLKLLTNDPVALGHISEFEHLWKLDVNVDDCCWDQHTRGERSTPCATNSTSAMHLLGWCKETMLHPESEPSEKKKNDNAVHKNLSVMIYTLAPIVSSQTASHFLRCSDTRSTTLYKRNFAS